MLPPDGACPNGARPAPCVPSGRGGCVADRADRSRDRDRHPRRLGDRVAQGRADRGRRPRRARGYRRRVGPLPEELLLMPGDGVFATPRPVPSRRLPAIGGTAVVVLALPVFLVADLPLTAWAIAAGLWAAYQAIGLLLERASLGMDNLALAGVV